jgi:hypothetical protein
MRAFLAHTVEIDLVVDADKAARQTTENLSLEGREGWRGQRRDGRL